jgi:hypothetical protein
MKIEVDGPYFVIRTANTHHYYGTLAAAERGLARLQRISSATADVQSPAGAERSVTMNNGDLITNGTTRAVVVAATEAFIVARPEDGGPEFVIAQADAAGWSVVGADLNVERPFVVYAPDGTRVDGYKFESRALRNNKARFAGSGFWIGKVDPSTFTWVPA